LSISIVKIEVHGRPILVRTVVRRTSPTHCRRACRSRSVLKTNQVDFD